MFSSLFFFLEGLNERVIVPQVKQAGANVKPDRSTGLKEVIRLCYLPSTH